MRYLKHLAKVLVAALLLVIALTESVPVNAECSVDEAISGEACEQRSEAESEPEASFGESPWISFLKMIGALLVVIALLFGLLKFINKRARTFQETKALSLVSGVSLGGNRSVQIVKVGEKLLIVGVGEQVQLLQTIENPNEIEAILKKQQDDGEGHSLSSAVDAVKAKLLPKSETEKASFHDVLIQRLSQSKEEVMQDRRAHLQKRNDS